MHRRIPGWAWLPVGAAVGLAAARLIFAPLIVEHWPPPGASVPATTEIRITFDQAMDEASVIERLHVDSPQAGGVSWEGLTLVYRPVQAWPSGATVEVQLDPGARSQRGLSMVTRTRWSFTVAEARLVYLWPADERAQVYERVLTEADSVPLTAAPDGVTDFSIGARGTRLVYVARGGGGLTELRELDLVRSRDRLWFACPAGEECSSPELSPDGKRLAFVRETLQAEVTQPGTRRVWLLEKAQGTPVPISPGGDIASSPFWSPQAWLAFMDTTRGAILVVDATSGEPFSPIVTLPSSLGERGVWSPDGGLLIYPDLILPHEEAAQETGAEESLAGAETHLFRWDVSSGELTDLTAVGGWQAEDAAAAFTPDGEWMVFSRRLLSQGEWTAGKQLWQMRPDGSEAERLTDEATINHGVPSFGARGTRLAYLRYDLGAPLNAAQIWWFDVATRTGGLVVEGGYLPAWIP